MIRFFPSNFILAVVFLFLACAAAPGGQHRACLKDICYEVEVARTQEEWMKGLMFRQQLEGRRGMLFVFPSSYRHSFWMKDTLIPLDILWLDDARRVVDIKEEAVPCEKDPCPHYVPEEEAVYVLEVNAGEVRKHGIKKGDQWMFHLDIKDL